MTNKIYFLLALLALSLVVACGGQETAPATSEAQTEETNTENTADTGETAVSTEPEATDELAGSLEFMTGTSIDSELYLVYEELTDAFTAANPGVSVELVPSSTDHEGEIKTRLASGNIPDIWMTHGWSVGRYGDFLLPLENEPWAADFLSVDVRRPQLFAQPRVGRRVFARRHERPAHLGTQVGRIQFPQRGARLVTQAKSARFQRIAVAPR